MLCKLCKRRAKDDDEEEGGGGLCRYHSGAKRSLKSGYEAWKDAIPGLSWTDYLNRVKTAGGTGDWVKEVIKLEEGGLRDSA